MASNVTDLEDLRNRLDVLQKTLAENNDSFFLCSMAVIIFIMQCGFAFLEAGAVRSKNTTNILIKNLLDSSIAIIGYWSLGWAFAYGESSNETVGLFIGNSQFFLSGLSDYPKFFFHYVFAATAATIVSGAVAERCEFACFITYCSVISTFVYPILTHWGWSPEGWMSRGIQTDSIRTTYIDFAGSGLVHLCGGTASFVAARLMGPRIGRFEKDGTAKDIKGHSVPFAALGGFILMFGFLAFNGGSVATISNPGDGHMIGLAMTNTVLCGAWAALTFLFIHFMTQKKWTLLLTLNACLTGMVAACAACNKMEPAATPFTGVGAGLIYLLLCRLMLKWRIDDPLDAFAVHFGGGFWGLFSAVIVGNEGLIYAMVDVFSGHPYRLGQAMAQVGWQMICAVAIITWSALWMWPIFLFLKKIGKMRVSREVELNGLDIYKHGEDAYPIGAYGHGWVEVETVELEKGGKTSDVHTNGYEPEQKKRREVWQVDIHE